MKGWEGTERAREGRAMKGGKGKGVAFVLLLGVKSSTHGAFFSPSLWFFMFWIVGGFWLFYGEDDTTIWLLYFSLRSISKRGDLFWMDGWMD